MADERIPSEQEVFAFILKKIESVPHLEALVLLWESRPKIWSATDLAARLYVDSDTARKLLQDLHRESLISTVADPVGQYSCQSADDKLDGMMSAVSETYRRETIRISTMLHSKGSSALRDFARAFRFKRDPK